MNLLKMLENHKRFWIPKHWESISVKFSNLSEDNGTVSQLHVTSYLVFLSLLVSTLFAFTVCTIQRLSTLFLRYNKSFQKQDLERMVQIWSL